MHGSGFVHAAVKAVLFCTCTGCAQVVLELFPKARCKANSPVASSTTPLGAPLGSTTNAGTAATVNGRKASWYSFSRSSVTIKRWRLLSLGVSVNGKRSLLQGNPHLGHVPIPNTCQKPSSSGSEDTKMWLRLHGLEPAS